MDNLKDIQDKVIHYYHQHAVKRFNQYEEANGNDHCVYCLQYMPPAPASVLDIGSGSGRDAAFFARNGYQVTAIEPADELRKLAQEKHGNKNIIWVNDRLPELETLADQAAQFDHIHLSAVIFHLPETATRPILETTHRLLKENGTLFISLRNGPADPDRPMFNLDKEWIISQSKNLFSILDTQESEDDFKRSDVSWSRLILKR